MRLLLASLSVIAALLFMLAARRVQAEPLPVQIVGDEPVLPVSEFGLFVAPIREVQKMVEHVTPLKLEYFKPEEFQGWFNQMSPELLRKLDILRDLWGKPIMVSPAAGGVGRNLGPDATTQHNVDRWGEVRGVDIFPDGLNSVTAQHFRRLCREVGFTGIGIYNDTSPGWMAHVDVRADRTVNNPAEWARVGGKYVGIEVLAA